MAACIISTGDELLKGAIADANGAWIASRLHEIGIPVDRISVVGDDLGRLAEEIRTACEELETVVVGGGLGPTDDDLTARAAAEALDLRLERNAEAERMVRAAFESRGRSMNPVNLKQADLPEGCEVLDNDLGTAPGFAVSTPAGRAFFLPGVPSEMRAMFDERVVPRLPGAGAARSEAVFSCFGIGESDIQAALARALEGCEGVRLSFRTSFPENRVTAAAADPRRLEEARDRIREALGSKVFAEGGGDLPATLGRALSSAGLSIGTAESCTGGLIGHAITRAPGSSEYFRGAVVAYANDVKESLLGVPGDLIAGKGAVSEEVSIAMAEGARRALGVDVAIATSGVAGPGGGTPEKPVGTVHVAVAHPGGIAHRKHLFGGLERAKVKRISAWAAMRAALNAIERAR